MPACTFHPHIQTDRWCTNCARSACEACLVKVEFGQHCLGCAEGKRAPGEPRELGMKLRQSVTAGVAAVARPTAHSWGDPETRPGIAFVAVVAAFLAACALSAVAGTGSESLLRASAILVVLTGALLGLVLHEWGHAATAFHGGDDSVVEKGYLTMDVRRYVHPGLSIGLPIVLVAMGGLPLPGGAVLIQTDRLRDRWTQSAVSAAGPAASFAFGFILIVASTLLEGASMSLASCLAFLAYVQIGLVILNLIPVPGLDGYGIIEPHLSEQLTAQLRPIKQYGAFIVLALIVGTHSLDFIWHAAQRVATDLRLDMNLAAVGQDLSRLSRR